MSQARGPVQWPPDCATCGEPIDSSRGYREDPPGRFTHMHECFTPAGASENQKAGR